MSHFERNSKSLRILSKIVNAKQALQLQISAASLDYTVPSLLTSDIVVAPSGWVVCWAAP